MSLSVADTNTVLTKSIASASDSGVTASYTVDNESDRMKNIDPFNKSLRNRAREQTTAGNKRGLGDLS